MRVEESALFKEQLAKARASANSSPFWLAAVSHLDVAIGGIRSDAAALQPGRCLGRRRHDLTGVRVFRGALHAPLKAGLRVFYIACEQTKRAVILEYGQRRQGHPKDAYTEFGEHLERGYHDVYFRALGLTHAYMRIPSDPVPLSKASGAHGPRAV